MNLRPGQRLRSQVCTTEVVVVRPSGSDVDLTCGGQPMVDIGQAAAQGGAPSAGLDGGTVVGKRYGAQQLEVLVTKNGAGSLAIGAEPLEVADAAKLPSSD